MSRDPWADDWEDDWTKAAKTSKSSSEIWSQANSQSSTIPATAIANVTPSIAYRPQVKILKRETNGAESPPNDATRIGIRSNMDQATREARYREARERLFGKAAAEGVKLEPPLRRNSPATRVPPHETGGIAKPERQSKGPEAGHRGGFAGRGRSKVQK